MHAMRIDAPRAREQPREHRCHPQNGGRRSNLRMDGGKAAAVTVALGCARVHTAALGACATEPGSAARAAIRADYIAGAQLEGAPAPAAVTAAPAIAAAAAATSPVGPAPATAAVLWVGSEDGPVSLGELLLRELPADFPSRGAVRRAIKRGRRAARSASCAQIARLGWPGAVFRVLFGPEIPKFDG